jgi:hypothetical protein
MAIILAAIGVSLGIIFPAVQDLNDQLDLETNSSNLLVIDENFRDMMLNGYTSKLFYTMDLGDSGFFMGDISSTTNLRLKVREFDITDGSIADDYQIPAGPGSPTFINETQHRLIIRQELSNSILDSNSHQYLTGSGIQNMFYLNSIQRASVGWTILNQSRFNKADVYTALSYRNLITISKTISNQNLDVNATISIQRVKFDFVNQLNTSDSFITMQAEYQGISVTTYGWRTVLSSTTVDRRFYLETTTDLNYGDPSISGLINTEEPYSHEVPGLGKLNVRIQFIDHIIEILI